MQRNTVARSTLIAAFLLVFLLFGIDKFRNPLLWIGWMPLWMDGLLGLTQEVWLMLVGAIEILFAVLLMIPVRRVQQAATIGIILQLLCILVQTGFNDIAIRDAGLLLSAVALLLLL